MAFGVGAETDAGTIPSILNESSELTWLNFGGKAISSTQELLLFLFHHRDVGRLRRVVFFSGLNELLMPLLGIRTAEGYGPFFHLEAFDRRMNARRASGWRKLAQALRGRAPAAPLRMDPEGAAEGAVAVYRRNLLAWKGLCQPLGVELAFVLQPVVAWLEHTPSSEEAELFAELDAHPTNLWRTVQAHFTRARHSRYAERLAAACAEAGVAFHDAKPAFGAEGLDGAWLFVDRVHMTDRGHRVAADGLRGWGLA